MADNDKQIDLKKRARRRLVGAAALAMLAAIVLPMVMDREPRPGGTEIQIRIPSQEGANFASRAIQGQEPAPTKPKLPAQSAPASETPAVAAPVAEAPAEIDVQGLAELAAADPEARPLPRSEPVANQSKPERKLPARPETTRVETKPEAAASPPKPEHKTDAKPAARAETRPEATASQPAPEHKPAAEPRHDDGVRAATLLGENAASATSFVVQLGVFKNAAGAKTVQTEAKAVGYSSFVESVGDKTRVRAGPFESREAAEQAAQKLRKAGLSAVVQPRS